MKIYDKTRYDFLLSFTAMFLILIFVSIYFATYSLKEYAGVLTDDNIAKEKNDVTVILDAGHGGMDPGAIGSGDVYEKDLNLMLTFELRDILSSMNINTVLTRSDDRLLFTDEEDIKGKRKMYDLINRCKIAAKYKDGIFVSIHMNKFAQSQYRGLIVYYSDNREESYKLANDIQNNIKENLQSNNNRKVKNGSDSVYLLKNMNIPAILIECGFLSNEEELKDLCDAEYRKKMATLIAISIAENIE